MSCKNEKEKKIVFNIKKIGTNKAKNEVVYGIYCNINYT